MRTSSVKNFKIKKFNILIQEFLINQKTADFENGFKTPLDIDIT